MNRQSILLLGAAGFVCILALALYNGVGKVEHDLNHRSSVALAGEGLQWVAVEVDGRDLNLSGDAPSEKSADRAVVLISSLQGVNRVSEQFSFHAAEEPENAPSDSNAPWSSSIKAN